MQPYTVFKYDLTIFQAKKLQLHNREMNGNLANQKDVNETKAKLKLQIVMYWA